MCPVVEKGKKKKTGVRFWREQVVVGVCAQQYTLRPRVSQASLLLTWLTRQVQARACWAAAQTGPGFTEMSAFILYFSTHPPFKLINNSPADLFVHMTMWCITIIKDVLQSLHYSLFDYNLYQTWQLVLHVTVSGFKKKEEIWLFSLGVQRCYCHKRNRNIGRSKYYCTNDTSRKMSWNLGRDTKFLISV